MVINPSLQVINEALHEFIHADFEITTLATDCSFTEGPIWHPQGYYLFSDIPANCIYRINPGEEKQVLLRNSGTENVQDPFLNQAQAGSNALALDREGQLIICQHGSHRLAKWDGENLVSLVDSYNGKPLNSPNDLILHNDGRIYFSDPPYGLKEGKLNPLKFQPLAGVYCWNQGQMEMICDKYQYPNGVCLSQDQSQLYICSNKPFEKFISLYDTRDHSFIRVFAEENSDGIEIDEAGNIYLCNKDGLIMLDAHGFRMGLIQLPSIPSNICWGGKEGKDLFITARENVFLIEGLKK